ncbi:MAG: carboxylating nicotinate-nucleotide diphosphorylase [Chitinophagaceae bacterium]|nr:carboxylating nicotinate-nucleotide diphosphorylase [Chitinophagaceae bacterium]
MLTYEKQVDQLILNALEEDIGDGDHSTLSCIPANAKGTAVLKIKEDGILAGIDVAKRVFELRDPSAVFTNAMVDGQIIQNGEIAFEVQSFMQTILNVERVVLNIMQRMSGIATLTAKYADKLSGYKTKLLDTRKTTPNFRVLEKEAVRIGGGFNHRMGLYDMIMLKDNHIDFAGGIKNAIEMAHAYVQQNQLGLKIEIETRNIEEVQIVMQTGKVDRIMLDNFDISSLREALRMIQGRFETEASGGINLDNIRHFADTGVDFISAGALIHQARSLDLSLKARA